MTDNTSKPKQTDAFDPKSDDKAKPSVLSRISNWFIQKNDIGQDNATAHAEGPAKINYQNLESRQAEQPAADQRPVSHERQAQQDRRRKYKKPFKPRPPAPATAQKSDKTAEGRTYHGRQAGKGKKPAKPKETDTAAAANQMSDQSTYKPMEKTAHQVKLLINRDEPEECRIALVEDGRVESFHVETIVHAHTKGNIYKGKITAVEPNLQAAVILPL